MGGGGPILLIGNAIVARKAAIAGLTRYHVDLLGCDAPIGHRTRRTPTTSDWYWGDVGRRAPAFFDVPGDKCAPSEWAAQEQPVGRRGRCLFIPTLFGFAHSQMQQSAGS